MKNGNIFNKKTEVFYRLEEIRQSIRNENLSYMDLVDVADLIEYIDKNDIELLELAGAPEYPESGHQ